MKEVRLRFAPSPTGFVHIGGLRTALYNYLFAKREGGKFLLRIEDTDRTRFVPGAIENIIEALAWANITVDEGVSLRDGKIVDQGDFGPYIQSERVKAGIYRDVVDRLLEEGHAYYCFCSKERLEHVKEQQKMDGKMPKYDGLCRGVSLEEAKKRVAAGEEHVIRLKLPPHRDVEFHDLIKGKITINTDDMDDQVLVKSDGFPTYHLAVVVDDHAMGITHVVRGDEWLSSTPKHVMLYEALGWEAPTYVHLPTVLNKNGKKLSKRNDDASVEDFKKQGYLPEALVNYLALVGWSPETNEEILSLSQMEELFSFDRVSKAGGVFDKDKLNWVNAHYIKELSTEKLVEGITPFLKAEGLLKDERSEAFMALLAETFRESIQKFDEIADEARFLFEKPAITEADAVEMAGLPHVPELVKAFREELASVETVDHDVARSLMKKIQKRTGIKGKNLFMPTRAILTGNCHGPELQNVLELLGKEEILKRMENIEIKTS